MQHVMTHFERVRSMYDHLVNSCSLYIGGWMLSIIIPRSWAYAVMVHAKRGVLK